MDVKEIMSEKDKLSYFCGKLKKYQNKKQTNSHRTQLYKVLIQINVVDPMGSTTG